MIITPAAYHIPNDNICSIFQQCCGALLVSTATRLMQGSSAILHVNTCTCKYCVHTCCTIWKLGGGINLDCPYFIFLVQKLLLFVSIHLFKLRFQLSSVTLTAYKNQWITRERGGGERERDYTHHMMSPPLQHLLQCQHCTKFADE